MHREWLVEAPLGAHPVEILGARAGLGQQRHRIARQPHDGEDREAQDQQRDQRIKRAPDNELRHAAAQSFSSMSSQG